MRRAALGINFGNNSRGDLLAPTVMRGPGRGEAGPEGRRAALGINFGNNSRGDLLGPTVMRGPGRWEAGGDGRRANFV
jgi:hypothetical protein